MHKGGLDVFYQGRHDNVQGSVPVPCLVVKVCYLAETVFATSNQLHISTELLALL